MAGKNKELQEKFEVVGTYSSGMYDFDNRRLYCSLEAAQNFLHIEDYVTEIAVAVDEYDNDTVLKQVRQDITHLLQDKRGFHSESVQTWKTKRSGLLQAVKAERGLTTILLFLVIVIAAFMLLAVLSMMVMEKRRDIGILRSLGGTVQGVAGIFLFEGFIIGLIGTTLGFLLGFVVVENLNPIANFIKEWTGWHPFPSDIYILDKIPSVWDTTTVITIMVLTILISLIFSLLPAYNASRLEPIEAIRYE